MEKEIIISKRFHRQTQQVTEYLSEKFPSKTVLNFLERIDEQIKLISKHPGIGRKSLKRKNFHGILLRPYHLIFYRVGRNKIEIADLFDMRQNPKKRPY